MKSVSNLNKQKKLYNKGSGFGVILFGITLLLVLLFTAINIVNSKIVENGYLSLRDAVQSASAGSVIHLLTSQRENATEAQQTVISGSKNNAAYDIYLQLALGYLINRKPEANIQDNDIVVKTGEINNFIKLDHQKVVNSTMALLENAVIRDKDKKISEDDYKIMMFFIEPYQQEDGKKFFDIIAYGNRDYDTVSNNITSNFASTIVRSDNHDNMKSVYEAIEKSISEIVNCEGDGFAKPEDKTFYNTDGKFYISLNASGIIDNYAELIREMETYPHYLIVVKDFALPTIFDGIETNDEGSGIRSLFSGSQKSTLKTPMCALNTGKVERHKNNGDENDWSHNR